jgi:hypothetical protein
MQELEKWIEQNQTLDTPYMIYVYDLRALLAGKVLCDAEPVAWMWRCPAYCADLGWHLSKGRPADHKGPTETYEDYPLYAPANKGENNAG